MRRLAISTAIIAAALLLAGCAGGLSEDGEPLTAEQADTLAQARFQLAAQGEFVAEAVTGAKDDTDRLSARMTVSPDDAVAWGVLTRGPEDLAVEENALVSAAGLMIRSNSGEWRREEWGTGTGSALAALLSLASDRPENAQLLRQSDARYLGTKTEDNVALDVYRLPTEEVGDGTAVTRIWLDPEGQIARLDEASAVFSITVAYDATPAPRPAEVDRLLEELDE